MRFLAGVFIFSLSAALPAQKMLPAAEWCAAGKKFAANAAPPGGADTRSDSVDILKTTIRLDITDFTGQQINGSATLDFAARLEGISAIRLDLLNLTVDSITPLPGSSWSYDGNQIIIQLSPALNAGETRTLTIYYHGHPVQDASGWGGFYWQGNYAYNLGVGFAADPHTFGRAWFPCFDNFVERCRFEFQITTPADKPAFCNGHLQSQTNLPDNKSERIWVLDQEIPSYLACVAVGPYTAYKREIPGETGPIPVEIAVAPADSNKLKASFAHLPDALAAFEHWYGPFRWNKIGYSIVPFDQGAMEHATNIAYMRAAVDGTTGSETLFAHELSHHWWGDLATCSSAGDMWLNEGWAVYSEHLFEEFLYGAQRFDEVVRANFLNVLEKTHVKEGGYRAVSGVPHPLTYGEHVYNKGAVVAHNLRGYLGDSLFRAGLRTVLEDNQFKDWSSAVFRDKLSAATGTDLTPFFDDWVFSPGFTHFSVDSFTVTTGPVDTFFTVAVHIKQKRRGAPHFYQQVPLECTFVNDAWQKEYRTGTVSGENSTVVFHLPLSFLPRRVWVNTRQHLTIARAEKELTLRAAGDFNFSPAKLTVKANTLTADSVLMRVEHHYAMPDTAETANPRQYRLSNRYWTIDALPASGFDAEASIIYDGKGKLDQLDTELFQQTSASEDSLVLLYRPGPGYPWQEYPDYQKNTVGSSQDRFGLLRVLHVLPGQYAIAKGTGTVATQTPAAEAFSAAVFPNPGSGNIQVKAAEPFNRIVLFSASGEMLLDQTNLPACESGLSVSELPAGPYWILLFGKNKTATVLFQKI